MMKKMIYAACLALLAAGCGNRETYDAMGRFEATEVTVSAEATGKIVELAVQEGDSVAAGTCIGLVDTLQPALERRQLEKQLEALLSSRPDVHRQAAALQEQLAKAQADETRSANLYKAGAATRKQYDDARAAVKILQGQLDATLSQLNISTASINGNAAALQSGIARVEDRLAKCRISSPINGTVLMKYVRAGEFAAPGHPLFKVADLEEMYLRAYFTSDQLSHIQLGDSVKVVADFGGDERLDYDGRIVWIAQESEFTPKTVQTRDSRANLVYAVKIAVKNDGKLKIGLYGEVWL